MLYNRKIVIIGAGHVGTHCAAALSFQNICDEIVFIDKDEVKAKSQAMDLADSVCFLPSAPIIRTGDYRDCEDADIIVISAGVPRLPGQTRLDTLGASIECIKDVVDNLNKTDIKGIIITITNPADIIAYYVRKHTGLPKNRVFGTGTVTRYCQNKADSGRFVQGGPPQCNWICNGRTWGLLYGTFFTPYN